MMTHDLAFIVVLSLAVLFICGLIEAIARSLIRYYFDRKEQWLKKIEQEEKESE